MGHEPNSHEVIDMILKIADDKISEDELRDYIQQRDRKLRLEVDSSQLNQFLLDQLIHLYPDARFLLTIRDPYSWVDSFINHQLGRGGSDHWKKFRDFRFQPDKFDHPPEENALEERGLYTLDGYFSYWRRHNRNVLREVPETRLLVVRTTEITERAKEIAEFAGVSPSKVSRRRSHSNKAKEKYGVLEKVDREHLASKVEEHCASLMEEYFPEIRRPEDSLSSLSADPR